LRPKTLPNATAILRDSEGNEVKLAISCPDTIARINHIVAEVKNVQNPQLIDEFRSIAVKAVAERSLRINNVMK